MRCTIVGNSDFKSYGKFMRNCQTSDLIIAADGGIRHLEKIFIQPDLLLGDMDSIKAENQKKYFSKVFRNSTKVIFLSKEKDFTDIFFAVKKAVSLGATEINIFGCLEQRLDHSFANFCVAKYLSEKSVKHKLIADTFEAFVIKNGESKIIKNSMGKTVSVFPFGVKRCKISYEGLKYSLSEGYLESNFPLGISNKVIDSACKISVMEGYALVFFYYNL